jgi:hypothetical protein
MSSITSIFKLVQYNDYNELEKVIKSNKVDLKNLCKKNEYLFSNAVIFRSKECFDLLVESKYFDPNESCKNGLLTALEYYCNAKNESNSHYINKLKNKFVRFSRQAIHIILKSDCYDEFSDFIVFFINENPIDNIKSSLIMSLDNIISFKKIINIGLSMDLITAELAINIIKSANKDKQLTVMIEFINCGINIFQNQENVINYFLDNFHDHNAIKYIVDSVVLLNPNINLSSLLVKYINKKTNSYYWNQTIVYTCHKLYNIYINYIILKKLNCNFFDGNDILTLIINNIICSFVSTNYNIKEFDGNTLLSVLKLFDLFLEEKVIDNNTVIKKTNGSIENLKKKAYGGQNDYNYHDLQCILYLLKYLENKGIKSDDFVELKNLVIPPQKVIDVESLLPKKLKAIKWKY